MKFEETEVDGAWVVALEPIRDDRGFFARSWCRREFAAAGIDVDFVQENVGFSEQAGTLRGLHLQNEPFAEAKLVRCTAGRIWDVAVDVRRQSPTFLRWTGVELHAENRLMLLVPEGCAHGYVTLAQNSEVRYLTTQFYEPTAATGFRYDDEAFGIEWPAAVQVLSKTDREWQPFDGAASQQDGA
jgi:dTDP-4-dehydrorhamnose 3,5-epimerase